MRDFIAELPLFLKRIHDMLTKKVILLPGTPFAA